MEKAALKLLNFVESYATHPTHIVGKFIQSSLQKDHFVIVFDAQQFLEKISCSTDDGMELLCALLRKYHQMHEGLVGVACRVNFITYVVLHTYHTLAKEAVISSSRNIEGISQLMYLCENEDFSFLNENKENENSDINCCSNLMLNFIQELRNKNLLVKPSDILAETVVSSASVKIINDERINNSFFYSSCILHEYLKKTFGFDPLSCGYEAGKLAVDCFISIYSRLMDAITDDNISMEQERVTSLHKLVDQLLCVVVGDEDFWWSTGRSEGYLIPGISFITKYCLKRGSSSFSRNSVLTPLHTFESLLQDKGCHVEMLLLFSEFTTEFVGSDDNPDLQRLAFMVKSVKKGLVVIVIKGHVEEVLLQYMEGLGDNTRTVLIAVSVGQTVMTELAMAFHVLPRRLKSLHFDPVVAHLRIKTLFTTVFHKQHSENECRSLLLVLEPLKNDKKKNIIRIVQKTLSVVFGGKCAADVKLMERLFHRQLHHLVNVFCLPSHLNVLMPAGGMAEAYAVSYLNYKIQEMSSDNIFSSCIVFRLMRALKDALVAYMENVLLKSNSLTIEEAVMQVTFSQRNFSTLNWETCNPSIYSNDPSVGGTSTIGQTPGYTLYNHAILTPPFLHFSNTSRSMCSGPVSTMLLGDVTEWEAQVEVASAYLCIGRCLDRLCFTSALGKRSIIHNEEVSRGVDDLFFFTDVA
ncbi:putative ribose-phosphate pyrophosphokinase [Trypanosoma theileri]|uniref:Putative ribose-phosphate pyrophosphokinase n=1 Tax=Trypanosoma theileri TaxID=67003 RepID=A0A1X0P4F5_9TRYP|nr:putative ribose-phosphate pyrophosphokinase [Trypanosoma theileri]ORC91802.1 putative ribose-phosphate pyrophosphokinase [Trypanosoma theileri]